MAKKMTPWVYGQSPNPNNWHETATILKQMAPKKKSKGPSVFMEKMNELEQLVKGRRHAR